MPAYIGRIVVQIPNTRAPRLAKTCRRPGRLRLVRTSAPATAPAPASVGSTVHRVRHGLAGRGFMAPQNAITGRGPARQTHRYTKSGRRVPSAPGSSCGARAPWLRARRKQACVPVPALPLSASPHSSIRWSETAKCVRLRPRCSRRLHRHHVVRASPLRLTVPLPTWRAAQGRNRPLLNYNSRP
jgi:hypothetical protein